MQHTDSKQFLDLSVKLAAQYDALLKVVDALLRAATIESVDDITVQMKDIRETENLLRPIRTAFRENELKTPAQIREVTDHTIDVLNQLMPKLSLLESKTKHSAMKLFPKVREGVRAVQMKNAYKSKRVS